MRVELNSPSMRSKKAALTIKRDQIAAAHPLGTLVGDQKKVETEELALKEILQIFAISP